MKTLKILIITLLLCFVSNAQTGKNPNNNNWPKGPLKINGVSWRKVEDTRADEVKIKKLFGNDMKKGIDSEDNLFFKSKKKGLSLVFTNYYHMDGTKHHAFVSVNITNRHSNIIIMGVTLTIGDSINKLKNVKIDYKNNEIFFENGDAFALYIVFDPNTRKISKIEYMTID